jgi:predicted polyphosphate/ATP-dependent NAD kinase
MRKIQERLDDYASMGVQAMWVIDPWRGLAYFAGPDAKLHQVDDRLTVPGTPIAIDVSAIFDELDRIEKLAATRPEAG